MKMRRIWKWILRVRHPISVGFVCSYCFVLPCVSFDFYFTNVGSHGDAMMEGNTIARMWWQIMGPYRFIEIPIDVAAIFLIAYIFEARSRFLALYWLNLLALNSLFGFMTWLSNGNMAIVDTVSLWAMTYPIGLMSAVGSLPLTLCEIFIWPRSRLIGGAGQSL